MNTVNRRARSAFVLAVAASLLLAGCADASAVPTTSPTRTVASPVTAAPKPGSRVPLTCSQLYTPDSVTPLVGSTVTTLRNETTPPGSLNDIAAAQSGVLGCDWGGGDATETGHLADLTVYIAPDAKAAFVANYAKTIASRPKTASAPVGTTAGDQSGFWCEAGGQSEDARQCSAQMRVGNYWVSVVLQAVGPITEAATSANMKSVLTTLAAALRKAGEPRHSVWAAPATSPPDFCTDAGSTAQVRTILGSSGFTRSPTLARTVDASVVALTGRDSSCSWTDPALGAADVEILASGSWAFPGFVPVVASDSVVQSYAPATVPGASSAFLGAGEGVADAYLVVGTSVVRISMPDLGPANDITALSAFAKVIAST